MRFRPSMIGLCLLGALALASPASAEPHGWRFIPLGAKPGEFTLTCDDQVVRRGSGEAGAPTRTACLRCNIAYPAGPATISQCVKAQEFRAKRVRFACSIRTEEGWAGLWLRADGADTRVF